MTTTQRQPIGAIGDAPAEAPRYVPGPTRSQTPLDCRPLSAVHIPSLDRPRVVWRPQRRSLLYWWRYYVCWYVADAFDWMLYETGWVGQAIVMVLCAVGVLALVGMAAWIVALVWLAR